MDTIIAKSGAIVNVEPKKNYYTIEAILLVIVSVQWIAIVIEAIWPGTVAQLTSIARLNGICIILCLVLITLNAYLTKKKAARREF